MSDFTVQAHIAEALDTIDNLLKCLEEEEKAEIRNILLRGVIGFYRDGNIEAFGITMLEFFNQTASIALQNLKEELEKE